MSKPGISFGLNLSKKPGASKPAPPKRKPLFGGGDDSDDDAPAKPGNAQAIGELDGFETAPAQPDESTRRKPKGGKNVLSNQAPPTLKSKKGPDNAMFGDLSGSLTSRKNAEAAEELDPSVYDYDKVYDTFKPQAKKKDEADVERKPRYMTSLLAAAAVRKRDALIAEEKKIARDREMEGEEFADKEKFVTEAYKRQQEENRRLEEEEKRREEEEEKKNKTGGMNAFYKGLLNKEQERHKEMMQAAEEKSKQAPAEEQEEEEADKDTAEADKARAINELGGSVAVNEEGQVVDKRQLLRGGLNIDAKKEARVQKETEAARARRQEDERRRKEETSRGGFIGAGGKNAMRERQTRMMEQQLEAALKRTRDDEEEERAKIERASKSRKTEGEISSAKERYLARKREAEEAKKKGMVE